MANRDLYTIGWICAISTQLVAALAFLDEKHDRPRELDPNDSNSYELGKISGHYVAIACLPDGEQGIAAAAGAATNLLRSFPNIRFGLMVGTGGGAPSSHHDIRLGDVVVSTPRDGKGGVLQYDFGKTMQNQDFVETGFLDQPPRLLRAAVTGLRAGYEMHGHSLAEEVNKVLQRKSRLQKTYCRPQTGDILYKSAYTHISGPWETCEACDDDPSNCIPRRWRDENDDDPVIHYGLIASANQRMENALIRDKLAMEKGVLCFEMEAAGLMNHFPCLIIRGICDYADTHRNDKWQGYASMMAAAYARDLIRRLIPGQVEESKTANEILLSLTSQVSELIYTTDKIAYKLDLAKLSIAEGAEYGSYADQHEDECLPGTRTKILHDIEEWTTSLASKCIFWLNGMAGTGKSTISRTVAKRLQAKQVLGASFFFKKGEADRGNATRFFSTIASQLQTRIPGMADHLRKVIDSESQISTKSLKEQFEWLILEPISCLKAANSQPSFLVVVIDALDECDNEKDIQVILNLIPQLQKSSSIHFRVFITSRPELPIRLGFKDMEENNYQDLILHQIPEADIEHDIRFFLTHRLAEIRKFRMLPKEWPGETNINTLTTMSIPLFIFAATMCRVFEDHNLDPQKSLDEYLEHRAEASELDAIYIPVLNQICTKFSGARGRKDRFIQDVREVISAIILLEDPLPIASLSKLIRISTEAISSRVNSLHSVLDVPNDETLPIRPFHLSFRDFLLNDETRQKMAIWTDEEATNEKLFIQCLNIMRNCLKKNICNFPSYSIGREDISDEAINQYLPMQLKYSCCHWIRHLMKSQDPKIHLPNVQSFLAEHLLHWAEVMVILDRVGEVLTALSNLQLIKQESDSSGMSEFLHDAKQFILGNLMAVMDHPLQLYVSGLIFAPAASTVKMQFVAELPDFISMPHNIRSSWGEELRAIMSMPDDLYSFCKTETIERGLSFHPTCLAISPNGLLLAAGFSSGVIILWNTVTHAEPDQIWGNGLDGFQALAFSRDSKLLVSCARGSGKIEFWDTDTCNLQSAFDEDVSGVTSLFFTAFYQLLASPSKAWDFLTWDRVRGIQRHLLTKRLPKDAHVALSPSGFQLASHCGDRNIDLWNLVTRNLQYALMGHDSPVTCTTFSSDGRLLASGDEEGAIILWDVATGIQRQHIMKHIGTVLCITFSTGSQLLASSHKNYVADTDIREDEIALWDLNQYSLIQVMGDHFGKTDIVVFSPDNKTLTSSTNVKGACIRLWDITNITRNQQPHPAYVVSVTFSFDGRLLASVCAAGRIIIWNIASEKIYHNLGERYSGNILTFSINNTLLAFTSSPGVIELWNINTRMQQCNVNAFAEINCVAFSPGDRLMACLVDHQEIKIWDISTKTLRQTISNPAFDQPMDSLCFSPNGQYLASSAHCTLHTQSLR